MGTIAKVMAVSALAIACDTHLSPNDGRHGSPVRAAWLVRLDAPGRTDSPLERKGNGAAWHLLVVGPPGPYEVSASISGSSCEDFGGDAPVIDVRGDDVLLAQWVILGGSPSLYHAQVVLAENPRRLDFVFTNDSMTRECYRNVGLHWVEILEGTRAGKD